MGHKEDTTSLAKLPYQAVSSLDQELAGTISGKPCPNLRPVIMGICLFNLQWIWPDARTAQMVCQI